MLGCTVGVRRRSVAAANWLAGLNRGSAVGNELGLVSSATVNRRVTSADDSEGVGDAVADAAATSPVLELVGAGCDATGSRGVVRRTRADAADGLGIGSTDVCDGTARLRVAEVATVSDACSITGDKGAAESLR